MGSKYLFVIAVDAYLWSSNSALDFCILDAIVGLRGIVYEIDSAPIEDEEVLVNVGIVMERQTIATSHSGL